MPVDKNITQLTADTTPSSTDIIYSVKDPSGTPLDRKVEFGSVITNLINPSFLKLDQTTPQTVINGAPIFDMGIDAGSSLITNVLDPVGPQDAATKFYVDSGIWLLPPIIEWYDPTGGLPIDPDVGDRYGSDGTAGGWTDGYIYEWDGDSWIETEPEEGFMIWDLLELIFWVFFSGGWMEEGSGLFWSLDTDQLDVTGSKTGSFNLTTTGDITADNLNISNWNTAYGWGDHSVAGYFKLAGVSGGQTAIGGTGTTDTLIFRATSGVGTTGSDIIFQVGNNGATEALRIHANGNIGVGVASPTFKMYVNGSIRVGSQFVTTNGTVSSPVMVSVDDGNTGWWNPKADTYALSTGGVERFRVGSSGLTGIGVTSPTARLHLSAGTATSNTSPFKLSSGVSLTIPESGSMEYDGVNLYFTPVITRKTVCFEEKYVSIKTSAYTITTANNIIICNSTSPFTISLPAATGTGREYTIKNINTGTVTIDGDISDTIDGLTTQTIGQWDSITVIDYSTNVWIII